MDFTQIVDAVHNGDKATVNRLFDEINQVIIEYLRFELGATIEDAKEHAQDARMHVYEAILAGKVKHPERIKSYFITTCRNGYLKKKTRNREFADEEIGEKQEQQPTQLDDLIEEERKQALARCMDKLTDDQYQYIQYFFDNPDSDTDEVATFFDLSHSNVWVKKHRIIQKLQNCVKKSLNE